MDIFITDMHTDMWDKEPFKEYVPEKEKAKVDESKKRIFHSSLFSTVEILNKVVDKENGLIDIEIKVREYKSSSIEADIGFKEWNPFQENLTTTGIDAQTRWVIGNIFNTTTNIEFTGRIARRIHLNIFTDKPLIERDFTAIYRTPWTFYFRIPTRFEYFHKEASDQSVKKRDGLTYSLLFKQG